MLFVGKPGSVDLPALQGFITILCGPTTLRWWNGCLFRTPSTCLLLKCFWATSMHMDEHGVHCSAAVACASRSYVFAIRSPGFASEPFPFSRVVAGCCRACCSVWSIPHFGVISPTFLLGNNHSHQHFKHFRHGGPCPSWMIGNFRSAVTCYEPHGAGLQPLDHHSEKPICWVGNHALDKTNDSERNWFPWLILVLNCWPLPPTTHPFIQSIWWFLKLGVLPNHLVLIVSSNKTFIFLGSQF